MCPHTSEKRSKAFAKSSRTKQFYKSSYTIPKRPPEEKCGEQTKAKRNASQFKVISISGWKSLTKRGKLILVGGWERRKTLVVSSNGVTCVLKVNVRIVQTYSPT
jgi:hypothetical protein